MKILIAGFQHETNTFAPSKADWDDFVQGGGMPCMTHGSDILDLKGINIPAGGFLDAMYGGPHQIVPVIWTAACPSAHVTEDAFERITGKILCGPPCIASRNPPAGMLMPLRSRISLP